MVCCLRPLFMNVTCGADIISSHHLSPVLCKSHFFAVFFARKDSIHMLVDSSKSFGRGPETIRFRLGGNHSAVKSPPKLSSIPTNTPNSPPQSGDVAAASYPRYVLAVHNVSGECQLAMSNAVVRLHNGSTLAVADGVAAGRIVASDAWWFVACVTAAGDILPIQRSFGSIDEFFRSAHCPAEFKFNSFFAMSPSPRPSPRQGASGEVVSPASPTSLGADIQRRSSVSSLPSPQHSPRSASPLPLTSIAPPSTRPMSPASIGSHAAASAAAAVGALSLASPLPSSLFAQPSPRVFTFDVPSATSQRASVWTNSPPLLSPFGSPLTLMSATPRYSPLPALSSAAAGLSRSYVSGGGGGSGSQTPLMRSPLVSPLARARLAEALSSSPLGSPLRALSPLPRQFGAPPVLGNLPSVYSSPRFEGAALHRAPLDLVWRP